MVGVMKTRVGNPLRKLVFLKLADNANDDGECWPSYQYIADQCEMSKRSAINHIDELVKDGFLRKEVRKGPKRNSSNLYIINKHKLGSESPAPVIEVIGASPAPDGASPASQGSASPAPRISHSFESVKEPKDISSSDDVHVVFNYWKQVMGKANNAKLTSGRAKCINGRLKEDYSVDDIKQGIDNCRRSDYHMGKNDTGTRYDDLTLICRSGEKLEQFMSNVRVMPQRRQGGRQSIDDILCDPNTDYTSGLKPSEDGSYELTDEFIFGKQCL